MWFFFLKKNRENFSYQKLKSNSNSLKHRGPDDDRIIDNEEYFARFFRLSIIDTSKKASQPMFDKTKRYFLIFNGEIYNFRELKNKLRNKSFNRYFNIDQSVTSIRILYFRIYSNFRSYRLN